MRYAAQLKRWQNHESDLLSRSLKSVLVLLPQILDLFSPPKKHVNFDISIFLSEAGLLNFSDFSGEFSENSYPIQYEYSIFVFSVLLEFCLSPKLFVPLASSANKLFGPPKCLVLLPRQPRYLISRNGFTLFLSSKVCIGSDRVKLSPFPLDFLGARMPQSVQPWNHVGKNKLHLPCEIWTNNHLCYKLAHPSDPNNL